MLLQAHQQFELLAAIEPLNIPLPDLKTDQSSSHNASPLRPRAQQSMDEPDDDLHMRRTAAHDDLVLQEPRDEAVERITRSSDGPAAPQVPVIPRHVERALVTIRNSS